MSKSYDNTILCARMPTASLRRSARCPPIRRACAAQDPGDPEKCPVWQLHQVYSDAETQDWVQKGCRTRRHRLPGLQAAGDRRGTRGTGSRSASAHIDTGRYHAGAQHHRGRLRGRPRCGARDHGTRYGRAMGLGRTADPSEVSLRRRLFSRMPSTTPPNADGRPHGCATLTLRKMRLDDRPPGTSAPIAIVPRAKRSRRFPAGPVHPAGCARGHPRGLRRPARPAAVPDPPAEPRHPRHPGGGNHPPVHATTSS